MHDHHRRRLSIIVAIVSTMLVTLFVRLYYVEELDRNKPVQTANSLHDGVVVVPAPRGLIVDALGRPLVQNTPTQQVLVSRDLVVAQKDHGAAVLARLARLLHLKPKLLAAQITPCSPKVPAPCWTGEPYQPVPVLT